MGDATDTSRGKFTLYTNHGCPWAHRAHIALNEMGLQFEETIIDLDRPRDEWYLKINDRGLVPTLQHTSSTLASNPVTVIESGLVVQYLIDAFPDLSSHIIPQAKDPKSAYDRYTINLLVDTWMNKINSKWFSTLLMTGTDEVAGKADELFEAIKTQFEPMLATSISSGKGPFAGGSERLTLLEILTGPFVLRIHDFSNDLIHPASLGTRLDSLPAYSKWSKAVVAQQSVTSIWDKEKMISRTQDRVPQMRKKYGVSK